METCSQVLTLHRQRTPNTVPNISEQWQTWGLGQELGLEAFTLSLGSP